MLFLEICAIILRKFSKRFFRDYFMTPFLGMARDPIANIRWRVVSLLPFARRTIRIPTDVAFLQKLMNDVVEPLLSRDTAKDVMSHMSKILATHGPLDSNFMPSTPDNPHLVTQGMKKSASSVSLTASYLPLDFTIPFYSDIVDKSREEEEQKLLFELGTNIDWSKRKTEIDFKLRKTQAIKKNEKPAPVKSKRERGVVFDKRDTNSTKGTKAPATLLGATKNRLSPPQLRAIPKRQGGSPAEHIPTIRAVADLSLPLESATPRVNSLPIAQPQAAQRGLVSSAKQRATKAIK
jgi:hypothetical protein